MGIENLIKAQKQTKTFQLMRKTFELIVNQFAEWKLFGLQNWFYQEVQKQKN